MIEAAQFQAVHEGFVWPNIDGLDLTLEQKVALGRCGNESAFYDMVSSMENHTTPLHLLQHEDSRRNHFQPS